MPAGSVSNAGQNMTEVLNFTNPGGKPRVAVYQIANPAVGSNSVSVSLASGNSDKCAVAATSFSGVDQAIPIGSSVSSSGSNSSPSVSVNSQSNDMVMGVMATVGSGVPDSVPSDSQYVIEMGGSGNSDHYTAASTRTGASNVTMNWDLDEGKEWVTAGININAAQ